MCAEFPSNPQPAVPAGAPCGDARASVSTAHAPLGMRRAKRAPSSAEGMSASASETMTAREALRFWGRPAAQFRITSFRSASSAEGAFTRRAVLKASTPSLCASVSGGMMAESCPSAGKRRASSSAAAASPAEVTRLPARRRPLRVTPRARWCSCGAAVVRWPGPVLGSRGAPACVGLVERLSGSTLNPGPLAVLVELIHLPSFIRLIGRFCATPSAIKFPMDSPRRVTDVSLNVCFVVSRVLCHRHDRRTGRSSNSPTTLSTTGTFRHESSKSSERRRARTPPNRCRGGPGTSHARLSRGPGPHRAFAAPRRVHNRGEEPGRPAGLSREQVVQSHALSLAAALPLMLCTKVVLARGARGHHRLARRGARSCGRRRASRLRGERGVGRRSSTAGFSSAGAVAFLMTARRAVRNRVDLGTADVIGDEPETRRPQVHETRGATELGALLRRGG